MKVIEWLKEEVERLDSKWIDNNTAMAYTIAHYSEEDVPVIMVSDLKNLLVPKQELPVIPKFVADWIEEVKKQNKSLVFAIGHIYDKNEKGGSPSKEENRIFQWMELDDNEEVFARAWLDGYTVEEEQKYVVPIDENHALCKLAKNAWGIYKEDIGKLYLDDDFKFTEQEIKDYDERFWPFAVKVEELEE